MALKYCKGTNCSVKERCMNHLCKDKFDCNGSYDFSKRIGGSYTCGDKSKDYFHFDSVEAFYGNDYDKPYVYCRGTDCSRKNECAIYINNQPTDRPICISDYSTSGVGYSKVDKFGNFYMISPSECGNRSEEYPHFKSKNIEEEPISIRQISQNICQLFENILDKHNIDIPDPDREISEEDSSQAHIYGVTYFTLEDEVTEILAEFANRIKRDDIKIQTDTY